MSRNETKRSGNLKGTDAEPERRREIVKKEYAKSRAVGKNHISITATLAPGESKKVKKAIRQFIKKLRKVTNGQMGFEYEIISKERNNEEAE